MPQIDDPTAVKGAKLVSPIPALRQQVGPTCGLYALSMVAHFWYDLLTRKGTPPLSPPKPEVGASGAKSLKEQLNEEIIARAGKTAGSPVKVTVQAAPSGNLLEIAQSLGSRIGEVFDAETLAMIARQSGFDSLVAKWRSPSDFLDLVKFYVDQNVPPIIGYDNSDTGDPGAVTYGARAHWAVIIGYAVGGTSRVITAHGWGHFYLWTFDVLERSNAQLDNFGKWGTWYRTDDKKGKVGWEGPGVPKTPTSKPSVLPQNVPKPANAVAAFQISHELDLKNQLVIVLPKNVTDYSAPKTSSGLGKAAVTSGGGGHRF